MVLLNIKCTLHIQVSYLHETLCISVPTAFRLKASLILSIAVDLLRFKEELGHMASKILNVTFAVFVET